jgi:hypothetical protein
LPKRRAPCRAVLCSPAGTYSFFGLADRKGKGCNLTSRTQVKEDQCSPGPGQYSPATRDHIPAAIMSGTPKQTLAQVEAQRGRDLPSPQQYNIKIPNFTKGIKFTSSKRNQLNPEQLKVPGPGQYDTRRLDKSPSAVVLSRKEVSGGEVTPGPSQYRPNYDAVLEKVRGTYLIRPGKEPNLFAAAAGPGPQTYKITTGKGSPAWHFARSGRAQS